MLLQKLHLLLFFSYASEALEHVRKLKVYTEQYAWLCCVKPPPEWRFDTASETVASLFPAHQQLGL